MTHELMAEPKSSFLMPGRALTTTTLLEQYLKKSTRQGYTPCRPFPKACWKAGDNFGILSRSAGNSQAQRRTRTSESHSSPDLGVSWFSH